MQLTNDIMYVWIRWVITTCFVSFRDFHCSVQTVDFNCLKSSWLSLVSASPAVTNNDKSKAEQSHWEHNISKLPSDYCHYWNSISVGSSVVLDVFHWGNEIKWKNKQSATETQQEGSGKEIYPILHHSMALSANQSHICHLILTRNAPLWHTKCDSIWSNLPPIFMKIQPSGVIPLSVRINIPCTR